MHTCYSTRVTINRTKLMGRHRKTDQFGMSKYASSVDMAATNLFHGETRIIPCASFNILRLNQHLGDVTNKEESMHRNI